MTTEGSNRIECPVPTPVLVMLESPYSASEKYTIEDNIQYALAAMKDSYMRGEAP